MAALIQETRQMADECRTHVEGPTFNAERAKTLIAQLRMSMTRFDTATTDASLLAKQIFLSREILELAVIFSVKSKDEKSFERYFSQLKPYYFDYKLNLPESERKNPILGLYLLFLLAEGRIGDFHTELEIVTDHHDRFIRYSIDLERDIMEGRYNKLMGTIRNDVASCIEASYENLTVGDAAKLLMFGQPNAEFEKFCQSRDWVVDGSQIHYAQPSGQVELPATSLINQSLSYAHEIERII